MGKIAIFDEVGILEILLRNLWKNPKKKAYIIFRALLILDKFSNCSAKISKLFIWFDFI